MWKPCNFHQWPWWLAASGPLSPLKLSPTIQSPSAIPQCPHYTIPKTGPPGNGLSRPMLPLVHAPNVAVHVQCSHASKTPHHDALIMAPTSKCSTCLVIQAALSTNQSQVTSKQTQPQCSFHHSHTDHQPNNHTWCQASKRGKINIKPKNYTSLYKYVYKMAPCLE